MNYKKIKIIFLIADSSLTGAPVQLLNLVKNLDKRYYELMVICPKGFLTQELKELNIHYKIFNFKKGLFQIKRLEKIIYKELKNRTILHAQGVTAGHFAKLANKSLKQYLIYTEHNWTNNYHLKSKFREILQLFLLKKLSRHVNKTVCVSGAVQQFLIKKKIVTEENSIIIYNGVNFPKRRKNLKYDHITIGSIASLEHRKGVIFLLEAIYRLKQDKNFNKKIIVKIIGKGNDESFLKQHAVDLGINFDIQWLGVTKDLSSFFSSINIYIQPSLDESFGMAVAEAMGAGIPVIASRVGGLPEVVGEYGILVEPRSSKALKNAILNVVNNKVKREENIKNGVKYVKTHFDVKGMAKNYADLYRSFYFSSDQ